MRWRWPCSYRVPRAQASPFRFVVLDDPIQAIDPSKIDGFLEVMTQIGQTHQVIVLTHDDRLPAAVRRGKIDARMFEVTRGAHSVVHPTEASRPALRFLEDGRAVIKVDSVPVEIKNRTIPTLCREAFEDIALEVFAGRALAKGWSSVQVESAWKEAQTSKKRLALGAAPRPERGLQDLAAQRSCADDEGHQLGLTRRHVGSAECARRDQDDANSSSGSM